MGRPVRQILASSLESEIAALHAALERHRIEDVVRERQLDRYESELRATSRRERHRARELRDSYMATVRALSNAVEARDAYTARHAERVAAYGVEIGAASGLALGDHPEIEFGFLLHDIGKVAVPDAILFKPGRLDHDELEIMRRHPLVGEEIIGTIAFLQPAREVIRHHHERWDGSGYPDGLEGEEIPFAARVFAVADALDALTSDRPYRRAVSLASAREVLRGCEGQFDPEVIATFELIPDTRLEEIRQASADGHR